MARKSLSTDVIEELDRARGLLAPLRDIVDPTTSHLIGAALESLHRVETMCLAAKQRQVNSVLAHTPLAVAFGDAPADEKPVRRRTAAAKKPAARHKES